MTRERMKMYSSVSYLGNGWTDCAEISCAVRRKLAKRFTQVCYGGTPARANVHTRFPYLGNGWADCTEAQGWWEMGKWCSQGEERSRFVTCDSSRHTRSTRAKCWWISLFYLRLDSGFDGKVYCNISQFTGIEQWAYIWHVLQLQLNFMVAESFKFYEAHVWIDFERFSCHFVRNL